MSGANAHYTHERVCGVLGARHETVPEDARGRLDLDALAARLARGGVGTVVATPGTTGLGAVDDVAAIAGLCAEHGARLHVDAAYGGFFALLADGAEPGVAAGPFAALARADSIVVDPHKHGLQPYGCGCVLFADPSVGRLYAHDSPYTYFTSGALHLGEISLECSRAGAAAAALWTTLRALPLTRAGLGRHVGAARGAALAFAAALDADPRTTLVVAPELDIVCAFRAGVPATAASASAERAFDALAAEGWHVAKLPPRDGLAAPRRIPEVAADAEHVTVLRCCLLKAEHAAIVDELAAARRGRARRGLGGQREGHVVRQVAVERAVARARVGRVAAAAALARRGAAARPDAAELLGHGVRRLQQGARGGDAALDEGVDARLGLEREPPADLGEQRARRVGEVVPVRHEAMDVASQACRTSARCRGSSSSGASSR